MASHKKNDFAGRFRRRVLLPGGLIILATALLCGWMLTVAGRNTDDLSVMAQQLEVQKAMSRGMDELALAQESIGMCEQCLAQASSPDVDESWLHDNIGERLFELAHAQENYIVNGNGDPVYAAVEGRTVPPARFAEVSSALSRFISLARGEIARPIGRSNLSERLPGSPPEPFVIPAAPGFSDEAVTLYPTVRTTDDVVHATDLVRIGDRIAFVSAMPMARAENGTLPAAEQAPVLVSLRYLDDAFLAEAERQNYLLEGRISDSPTVEEGESSMPLINTDGVPLATFFWKPQLGGEMVVDHLWGLAIAAFAIILAIFVVMALSVRKLMRREDENLSKLEEAHIELQAKEAQAHHLAFHDALTGLPNRALFNDRVEQALSRVREGDQIAIVLLDLDRFKHVNDCFGHLVGDELIREVGKRLSSAVKRPQAVARLGGDEFAVLLEKEDLCGNGEAMLDRIMADLQHPYDLLGNQAHVGVSLGVALAPEYGCDRTDLLRKADIALYRAKAEGRNCYRFFDRSMDETVQLRSAIEADLRNALENDDELSVYYQPLVGTRTNEVEGFEALLRWQHEERGWVPPQLFVAVAEETGLISALGEFVLRDACKVAAEWPSRSIAINLSPMQFHDENFAERTCKLVREAGVHPRQIEFEVTESVVLDQNEKVRNTLRDIRKAGFRVALDDFGTGYSSLSNLRNFEVDRIKIDKTFIDGLGTCLESSAITTAVITLGHAMGLQVTAEGIETTEQRDFLCTAGCNVLQGHYFSKAVPADELSALLKGRGKEQVA